MGCQSVHSVLCTQCHGDDLSLRCHAPSSDNAGVASSEGSSEDEHTPGTFYELLFSEILIPEGESKTGHGVQDQAPLTILKCGADSSTNHQELVEKDTWGFF